MQATNHPKGNFPRRQFPEGCGQGAITFEVIVREQSSRGKLSSGTIIQGVRGNFPRGQLSGHYFPSILNIYKTYKNKT